MEIPHTHGFSLWLMPPEPIKSRLKEEIACWSATLETPSFEPHVTLLGGIKDDTGIAAKIFDLVHAAKPLSPLTIELGSARYTQEFYRCVYLNIWLTTSLQKLYDIACVCMRFAESGHEFSPHMSMVYGSVGLQTQDSITHNIGPRYEGEGFTVSEIALWSTKGPPDAWHQISSTFPF
ncbi:MAG: 2'-5' RNA ligase family protein [Patescibacteria group bacterium]